MIDSTTINDGYATLIPIVALHSPLTTTPTKDITTPPPTVTTND